MFGKSVGKDYFQHYFGLELFKMGWNNEENRLETIDNL